MKTINLLALLALPCVTAITKKDGDRAAADFVDAISVNVRPECYDRLTPIVAAIRYAENGGPGREYGVLHPGVLPTYRSQAGWAAATVQKNYDRWVKAGRPGDFIEFLGSRYCPVGADNDPNGLNRHWVGNVTKFTNQFRGQTMDTGELGYQLISHCESETRGLSDEEYIEVLEEVSCALDASIAAKRAEMKQD